MPRWRGPPLGPLQAAMPPPLHVPRLPAHEGPLRRYTPSHMDLLPPPGMNRRNTHVTPSTNMRPPPPPGAVTPTTLQAFAPTIAVDRGDQHACSLFSDTVCASVDHYPEEAILASLHADKHTADALLADKLPPAARASVAEMQRRQDDDYPSDTPQDLDSQDPGEDAQLCPSIIKYARPQRARATSGQWKYIVNTAEHTQTLRLEKCMRVEEPCNYLADNIRSHCSQVYNYHRLLTWDKDLGLHMDIFKVPTCCSCQIQKSPFLTSNSVARRPNLGSTPFVPHQSLQPYPPLQPVGEYSNQETVVVSESGRPVHPQYTQGEVSNHEQVPKTSSKPTWPFRKAATRRPPVQTSQGHPSQNQVSHQGPHQGPHQLSHPPYGLQTLEESASPGAHLPQYPPLPLQNEYEYPPLSGRRTASVRNRTRVSERIPDDLTAEGSQRHPIPVILSPEGMAVRPAGATSRRPPALPPRLETYRPRATSPRTTSTRTTSTSTTSPRITSPRATSHRTTSTSTTTPRPPIVIPTTTAVPGAPTLAPKRVNYSYHPIIDFFRPLEKQMSAQEPRAALRPLPPAEDVAEQRAVPDSPGPSWSAQQSDWSPITRSATPST